MAGVLQVLKKASDITEKIAIAIVFVFMIGVTVLALIGVFFRQLGASLSWNEELMRWLLIGIGFIGASVALKHKSHIGIEFLLIRMSKRWKKAMLLVGYGIIILFLYFMLDTGWVAAMIARRQLGSIIRIQMMWVKLTIPLGAIFMLIHMAYFSLGLLTEKEEWNHYIISGGHEF